MAVAQKYQVHVRKGNSCCNILTSILFSHLGLCCLCILYALIGAYLFIKIEGPYEESLYELKKVKSKEVTNSIEYLKIIFWEYATDSQKYDKQQFRQAVYADLNRLKYMIVRYNNEYGYDGTEDWDYSWTFANALLFTTTVMTTVGYGHISPQTFYGRLFCIFYALIGIVLLPLFLANIGDFLAKAFKYLYSRCCCRWCRVRRKDSEYAPNDDRERIVDVDPVGTESYMPTNEIQVPIMVNLMLIFVMLMLGAVTFSDWEEWSLSSSIYFCFITLTTIGFGDMVPEKSFLHYKDGPYEAFKMTFTVFYVIFGMTLLSMCISLMQDQIIEKVTWVARELGMTKSKDDDDDGDAEVEPVKITKEEYQKSTPTDLTGNELDFNARRKRVQNYAK